MWLSVTSTAQKLLLIISKRWIPVLGYLTPHQELSQKFAVNIHCLLIKFCSFIERFCMRCEGEWGLLVIYCYMKNDPKTQWLKKTEHSLFIIFVRNLDVIYLGPLLWGVPKGCSHSIVMVSSGDIIGKGSASRLKHVDTGFIFLLAVG